MEKSVDVKGVCLCGSVKVSASVSPNVGACHCRMCRNWCGGMLMTLDGGSEVAFEGEEHISTFASSQWAERGFCKNCGSNLFYRLKQNGQYFLGAGLFETQPEWHFGHQVFIDEKPEYYAFANETHNMTGAELFAKFAPPG